MENEINEQPSKISIALKYGLMGSIAGALMAIVKSVLGQNPFEGKFDWTFWVSLAIAIAAIVLAHKEYKDSGNGYMSYAEGLGIGCLVGLVSSIVTILFTLIYVNFVDQTIMTQLLDKALEDMEKQNQPEQAFEFTKKYFGMMFYIFLIIGTLFFNFIYALVVSIFTQKKNPNPAF